jgi:subfamily B ATP-binding cassette protein MsbA
MSSNKVKYDSSVYLFLRLFNEHVKSQKRNLGIAAVCMLVIAATTALQAWLMEPVLNKIFVEKSTKMLYLIPLAVFANALIKGVASFYESSIMRMIGQRIVADIQLRLYSHLMYADMHYLSQHPSGNLISRFTNDINAMRSSVSEVLTGIAQDLVTLIGLLFIMFYQSSDLALIACVVFPIAFFPIIKLGRRMRKIARDMQAELGDFTVRLDETFQNDKIVKSYCREEYEISRAERIIDRFLQLYRKAAYIESASSPIMETLGGVAVAFIILYGGMQVMEGTTTPGSFFSFIAAMLMSYRPLKSISKLNTSMQAGLAAAKRIFTMLDEMPQINYNPDKLLLTNNKFDIEFKSIYFSYKTDTNILENLNMKIPHGKTVALIGSSGSGKSTVFNLLQRMYDPDYGSILLGGRDIREYNLKSVREKMALVSQEVALFDDTVYENIRYGKLDATEDEIIDAAMAAAAHDFITSLPEGYNTQIGQRGLKISGGQRQRIAIARAILKNAPLLLLDEATSALDSISEKQVQMALEYLKKGRTTIVIAHRLSTIERADLIYVISDGRVQEFGTHKELLRNEGEYARLHQQYQESNGYKA